MKIGIIAANNICISPYVNFYTKLLDENKIDYDVIYPNRSNKNEQLNNNYISIPWKSSNKLLNFYNYKKNVQKLIKDNKYDFLIVLTTLSAVLLSGFLVKNYKNKYLVDIRDYTHENNKLYYLLEKKVLKHSSLNVISSKEFTAFLPKLEYSVIHNVPNYSIDFNSTKLNKNLSGVIRLSYVGIITYENQCKMMMNLVNCDKRFEFHFYGIFGNDDIKNSIMNHFKELKSDNIFFHGQYNDKQKNQILYNTDILFNAYGNKNFLVRCLLSNKLYDSLYFKIPILTSPNTYMDKYAGYLSYGLNLEDACSLDDLYLWYIDLNEEQVNSFANEKILLVEEENRLTSQKIVSLIKGRR